MRAGFSGSVYEDDYDAVPYGVQNTFWDDPDRSNFGIADAAPGVANPAQATPEPMDQVPPQVATSVLGRAVNGGSGFGNTLREVPLIGGILGNIGDVGEGTAHFLTGDISRGAREITGGVGGLGQLGLADALATGAGALGKIWVTGVDLANVLSGGTLSFPDRSTVGDKISTPTGFGGALERFVYGLAIPTYDLYSGANWGSTQFGDHGHFFNLTGDAARVHDAHLNDGEWIGNIWNPAPEGIIPNGPGGIANFLLGVIPFWLNNGNANIRNPSEVTLTK